MTKAPYFDPCKAFPIPNQDCFLTDGYYDKPAQNTANIVVLPNKTAKKQTTPTVNVPLDATLSNQFKATKYEIKAFKPNSLECYGELNTYKSLQKELLRGDIGLSANIFAPDILKASFCPPKVKNGKITSDRYSDWRAKEIVHLDAGIGIRADGDGEKDKNPKIVTQAEAETGALVSIGEKNKQGESPFKLTAFDTYKVKYIPRLRLYEQNGYPILSPNEHYNYSNFMGLRATINTAGNQEFSISGGSMKTNKSTATPAIKANWKGFFDRKRTFFGFVEGLYIPKDKDRNELRCGVGVSMH